MQSRNERERERDKKKEKRHKLTTAYQTPCSPLSSRSLSVATTPSTAPQRDRTSLDVLSYRLRGDEGLGRLDEAKEVLISFSLFGFSPRWFVELESEREEGRENSRSKDVYLLG